MSLRKPAIIAIAAMSLPTMAFAQAPGPSVAPVTSSEITRGAAEATSKAANEKIKKEGEKAEEKAKEKVTPSVPQEPAKTPLTK